MKRLFDVSQAPFDFSDDLDKVIYVEPAARRTRNHGNATRTQAERLHNLPGDPNLFVRFSRQRNTNSVADSFMQKNAQSDGRLDRAGERRACFGHTEVKWIINLFC